MNRPEETLKRSKSLSGVALGLLLACFLTGFSTYFIETFTIWQQWNVLAHSLVGACYSIVLLPYLFYHFRRTLGFRRAMMLSSGILLFILFLCAAYSGWHMMFYGQTESQGWIYLLHVYSNMAFVALLMAHLILHIQFLPKNRANSPAGHFPTLEPSAMTLSIWCNLGLQLLIVILTISYAVNQPNSNQLDAITPYANDYGSHPFRPSQSETSHGGFIATASIANSHRCVNCHDSVGQQWLASVHQQAASDPTYVRNINLLEINKGITATRYCEGCHAPVALLTGQLSPGGKHGGVKGTPAFNEGVGCMGCHGIQRLTSLRGVASYEFTPAKEYLFAQSNNPVLMRLHDQLIRLKPSQHKADVGHDLLKDSAFCASCHTQFMDKDINNWGWVKMQDEYGDWLSSPHSGQNEENFSSSTVQRCQDCHMPLVTASDPSQNTQGKVRSHHFPGANTFLPLLRGDKQQYEKTKAYLQSNKMRVSIDKPSRTDAIQSMDYIDEAIRISDETVPFYYLGETVEINVVVSNVGVGHNFPGGTIDINEAWLMFSAYDAQGTLIYTSGEIQPDGNVDPNAHFYRALAVDRKGNLVWQHDLFNMIGESFKRVVPAGAADIATYRFVVPSWAKSSMTLTATLKYRKLNNRYAKWALQDNYFDIPAIDMAWDSQVIPLKIRKEVESHSSNLISLHR